MGFSKDLLNNNVSAKGQLEESLYVSFFGDGGKKVLFVGNSITRHRPLATIGWHGDWGMSASSLEKDYVHLVADELKKRYGSAHVAVHAEGYDRASVQQMWHSFSSKIVDCLSSGCAVLVACPTINCGCRYLLENEAAVCADQPSEIAGKVELLVKDAEQRKLLKERAYACMQANHRSEVVKALVYEQLSKAAGKKQSEE